VLAVRALGDVEDEIDAVGEEPLRQVFGRLDQMDGVPPGPQRLDDRLDRPRAVELRVAVEGDAVAPRLDQRFGG
jgi:hypothetical protein